MAAYGAAQRQDGRSGLALLDPDVVWDMSGLGMPDLAKVYRGHDGILEFWREWLGAWETVEFRALSPEDHGDHVIVEVEQRNRGRKSGVAVDFHYFQTFTFKDGRVTASTVADTRNDALEAVGIRE
jgi:ketosteroid isomerase-like protein